jgi:dienelactone hydrolase
MRIRALLLAAAVGAAGPAACTACSAPAAGSAAASPAAHAPSGGAAPAPAPHGVPADLLPVGTRSETIIDHKRGTVARWPQPARPYRVLPTTVFYPAASGPTSRGDTPGAEPRRGGYPLVVFAHGFDTNPEIYTPFLHALALHGYVVAAPLFPIESFIPGAAAARRSDPEMAAQMDDVSAVIDAIGAWAAQPSHWLHAAVDPAAVAVVGHSDGATTVGGMTMSSSYRDARIKAAVVLAGAPDPVLSYPGRRVVPTLVEQATEDRYNSPADAVRLYQSVVGPRAYLSVVGAQHIWPLVGDDRIADLVRRVVVSHLNMVLKGGGAASRRAMLDAGNQPGYDSLSFAS